MPARRSRRRSICRRFSPATSTWCQGYSETGAGSDLASLTTRAELDGDSFVVNGHKTWTTNGHFADWMFALVRTDPKAQPRHAGITMLLIDLKSPGITVRPIQTIQGDAEFAEEFFDERAGAAREHAGRAQRRLARRQQAARLRALHHRPSAQRRGLPQPGAPGRRISPARSASRSSCTSSPRWRSICSRSRPITATPPACTPTARRRPRWRRSSRSPAANSASAPPSCWSMPPGRSVRRSTT